MKLLGMQKGFLVGVLVAVVLLPSCKKEEVADSASDPLEREARVVKIPSIGAKTSTGRAIKDWKPYTVTDWHVMRKDGNLILHGIARKEFGNLSAFVGHFDEKYPNGTPYRTAFYDKFENYDSYNQQNAGAYHDQYLANTAEWIAANPGKAEPEIVLAAFHIHIGWYARGGGYSNTVTKSGAEEFDEQHAKARAVLESASPAARRDPHYHALWIGVHLAQGGDPRDAFKAGQEIDPTYVDPYLRMTNFLQPKWYGKEFSDWHTWLVEALEHPKLSEEDALVLYGEVVRKNLRGKYTSVDDAIDVYKLHGIDPDRFLRGLAACCRRYPTSSDWPSAYLYHAVYAGSEEAIKEALGLMDRSFSASVFGGEREFFVMLDRIAEEHPKLATQVR